VISLLISGSDGSMPRSTNERESVVNDFGLNLPSVEKVGMISMSFLFFLSRVRLGIAAR
jgi:hypothetical protein